MADSFTWYPLGAQKVATGIIDLDTDTLKVMLVDSTFSQSGSDEFVDDIVADEVSGTGYTGGFGGAGRKILAGVSVSSGAPTGPVTFSWNDVEWTGIDAGDILGMILIKEITNDSDSPVIGYSPFSGGAYSSSGNNLVMSLTDFVKIYTANPAGP